MAGQRGGAPKVARKASLPEVRERLQETSRQWIEATAGTWLHTTGEGKLTSM